MVSRETLFLLTGRPLGGQFRRGSILCPPFRLCSNACGMAASDRIRHSLLITLSSYLRLLTGYFSQIFGTNVEHIFHERAYVRTHLVKL